MIQFDCPKCRRHLKVSDEMAGRKGKCPGCAAALLIPQMLAGVFASPTARVRPAANGVSDGAARKLRLRPVADDNGHPPDASSGSQEEVPAFKPRKKKRKKKQAAGVGLWLAVAGLAILLLGGGGVGVYFAFFHKSQEPTASGDQNKPLPAVSEEELRGILNKYLPDDAVMVACFNGCRFAESPYVKDGQFKEVAFMLMQDYAPSSGVKPLEELKLVIKAVNKNNQALFYELAWSKWTQNNSANKLEIGGHTVYQSGMKASCLLDDYTRLSGDTPLVKQVLQRSGDAKLDPELKSLLGKIKLVNKVAAMAAIGGAGGSSGSLATSAGPAAHIQRIAAACKRLQVEADVTADLNVAVNAHAENAAAAQTIRQHFEKVKSESKAELEMVKKVIHLALQQPGVNAEQTKAANSVRDSLEIAIRAIEEARIDVTDGNVGFTVSLNAEKTRSFIHGMAEGQRFAKKANGGPGGGPIGPGGPGGGPIGPGGPGGGPIGPGGPGGGPIGPGGPGGGPIGPGGPGGGPIGPGGPGGGPIGPGGPGGGPIGPGGPGGGPIGPGGPGGGPIGPGGPGGGPIGPGGPGGGPIGPGGPGGGPIGPGGPGGGPIGPGGPGIPGGGINPGGPGGGIKPPGGPGIR